MADLNAAKSALAAAIALSELNVMYAAEALAITGPVTSIQ
jgi:hypothetical protein